ncbi:MAG TPA: LysE family translocator [Burkholderiaceae bacterium]|nr:LysE family translocator [Burkholderiaceae bacterium]
MTIHLSIDFLITSLVVVLVPGPGVVYTISTALLRGARASTYAALGCTAGIVPHLLASVLGLAALLHVSAVAFHTLRLAGVAYLLYLAWAMWQQPGAFVSTDEPGGRSSARAIVTRGFLMNILNPKLSIFFLAFLPQFVAPGSASSSLLPQMLVLSGVFMLMTFVVFVVYGVLAHRLRTHVMGSRRVQTWLQRGFAAAFAALGVNLALADR